MSAGGSTAGCFIRLVTAKEDAFAYLETEGFIVGQVVALACSSRGWGLTANKVRIHLVAVSDREPSEEEISAAWATGTGPLPVSARVDSGAWLVAVPTTPGSSGGGGEWRALENHPHLFLTAPLSPFSHF